MKWLIVIKALINASIAVGYLRTYPAAVPMFLGFTVADLGSLWLLIKIPT